MLRTLSWGILGSFRGHPGDRHEPGANIVACWWQQAYLGRSESMPLLKPDAQRARGGVRGEDEDKGRGNNFSCQA